MLGFASLGSFPIGAPCCFSIAEISDRLVQTYGIQEATDDRQLMTKGTYIFEMPLSYRILVDDGTNTLGEINRYRKVTIGKRLNNYGQADFDISVTDDKANLISLRKNKIKVYREYGRQTNLVWAGEQAVRRSNLDFKGNNWSEITCFSWFEQFFHRYTEEFERYELEDAGDVIDTLISTTQAKTDGDFGVTTGTIDTTYTADIIYQNDNIGEAILGLADGGLDFEITDNKVLNVSSILGTDKTNDVVIEYGHNVTSMTIIEDFSNPVNQALVLGEVIDEDTLQRIERTDTSSRSEYKLRQMRMNQLEPAIQSIFEDKGDSAIRKYKVPLIKVDFDIIKNYTPSIDQFTVGDGIRLIVKNGIYNIDEEYRVFEWQVTFDEKNTEKLTLILGKFTL